jgi:four helix bundle protein
MPNLVADKTFKFSLDIVRLYKHLASKGEFVLSKQLLRSGTSIGANVEEAIAAQSRKDFISKMAIACKEARETRYWLRLLNESRIVEFNYTNFLSTIEEIIKVITSIVKTSQENHIQSNSKLNH